MLSVMASSPYSPWIRNCSALVARGYLLSYPREPDEQLYELDANWPLAQRHSLASP